MGKLIDEAKEFLLLKPLQDQAIPVKYGEDGKSVVYVRRWFILIAFCLSYFSWNFHTYRTIPVVSEYALYFNQPNEVQAPPNLGIDFMLVAESFLLIVFYPLGGVLVDKFGIQMMVYGAIGQALGNWWWFLSFDNFLSVLLTRLLTNLGGICIGASLLRVSNNWFAEGERPLAVALGALFGSLGGGASLLVSPLFTVGDDIINLALISCRPEEMEENGLDLSNLPRECNDIAEEAFCCAADTNIDGINFFFAIWTSLVAIYTFVVTVDAPATPPTKSGSVRKGPPLFTAIKLMFSNWNYAQICLTDFVSSGPPLVLFSTVDRIFPPSVSDFSTYAASGGFLLAVPIGAYFSIKLASSQKFYEYTAAGYVSGFVAWLIATVLVFIDTETADYIVIVVGGAAIVCYVIWTVSVYELKMEYVFSSDYAIQGFVVAIDRTVINISATVFLAAIPPERYTGDAMSGRQFTFLIGAIFMLLGAILAVAMPHKRRYRRKAYEEGVAVEALEVEEGKSASSIFIPAPSAENTL